MIVIEKRWNSLLQAHELTYLANTAADVVIGDLDTNCAAGSVILVSTSLVFPAGKTAIPHGRNHPTVMAGRSRKA